MEDDVLALQCKLHLNASERGLDRGIAIQFVELNKLVMKIENMDRACAELSILRKFIDFVNTQAGMYMDCLAGFEGNTVRVHRQVARVQRRSGVRIENGQPVMAYVSVEDLSSPDAIHHRIIRAQDFLAANARTGFNEQQLCWSIIVFIFAYWDEEIRPQIATVRAVEPNDIQIDALGDLRLLRKSIIHNKGVLSDADHAKLKKMPSLFRADEKITPSHCDMHRIFVLVKQAIAEIIMTYVGHLPGAPSPSEIVSIAIQDARPTG